MIEQLLHIEDYHGGSIKMDIIIIIIKVLLAILMGGLLGYEREIKNKPAGVTTISLVCVGATMIGILQTLLQLKGYPGDMTRMGAQVISGVGFIGGGAILHTKGSVQGLTTAATLWISACLGLVIGYGMLGFAILSFICIFIILLTIRSLEDKYVHKKIIVKIKIKFLANDKVNEFLDYYLNENASIKLLQMEWINYNEKELKCTFTLLNNVLKEELIQELKDTNYIEII